MIKTFALALTVAAMLAQPIFAHHGDDFLLLEDATLPKQWHGYLSPSLSWENYDENDTFSVETTALLSVASQLALSVSTAFDDEDEDWAYSSVTPRVHVQLTPPDADFPIKVALSFGYQFAEGGEESSSHHHEAASHEHEHEAEEHGGEHEEKGHGEETDHAEAEAHSHSGIHNHDANQWVSRLVVEADLGSTKLLLNLIGNWPEGDSANFGYAVGVRHSFNDTFAAGVEAIGDFADEGEHEILLGGYVSPSHSVTLKLGVGFGLTEQSPDVTVRSGLVWRF
jgi:hypothetical protein